MCVIEETFKKTITTINNNPSANLEYQFNENVYSRKDAEEILKKIRIKLDTSDVSKDNTGWFYLWQVSMYYFIGDYYKANEALRKSFKCLIYDQQKVLANKFSSMFGFNKYYKDWKNLETDHFIFHYSNNSNVEIDNFTISREIAYKDSQELFSANLHRKIDFYIWDSREEAHTVLNRYLGFAIPQYYLIHSASDQSPGHELTHIITHYIPGARKKTSLITEGMAVMMDQVESDKVQIVRLNMIKNNVSKVDIKALWDNFFSITTQISYALSGVFVKALYNEFGESKFIELQKNQSYDNACSIYGKNNLDDLIAKIELLFNS